MKRLIEEALIKCGMPVGLKGFRYIPEACAVLNEEPDIKITVMYGVVAKKFDTTPSRVERAIRHAFERVLFLGDKDLCRMYFGTYTTNSHMLKTLLWNVKKETEDAENESAD